MSPTLRCVAKHPTISLVDSSTTLNELRQIHAQLLVNGLVNDSQTLGQFVFNIAIRNPTNLDYSNRLLTRSESPTLFALNSMIRAYSKSSTPHESFRFYNAILLRSAGGEGPPPDNFTLNFALRAAAHLSAGDAGSSLHAAAVKRGLDTDAHVHSALISMYAAAGLLRSCRRVFDESPSPPDKVSRTAMITAFARLGDADRAREMFDEMPQRDHVAWNAMLAAYAGGGRPIDALDLFRSMQSDGAKVNGVSMASVLSACAQLGALDHGRWAHAYIEKNHLRITPSLSAALVDMYAKCGAAAEAAGVFRRFAAADRRNVVTWNAAIGGMALNGLARDCLDLFSEMKRDGVEPDGVTFLVLLKGCGSAGLVAEGREIFRSMSEVHGIEPREEHFGCLVDLLGRAGELGAALEVVREMPMGPTAGAWGAILNACRMHGDLALAEIAAWEIVAMEPKSHGAHVQLYNMYAGAGDWGRARGVREAMRSGGVRKAPGRSAVEVGGRVHEFSVRDGSHPRRAEIEAMLAQISTRLKLSGPDMVDIFDPDSGFFELS